MYKNKIIEKLTDKDKKAKAYNKLQEGEQLYYTTNGRAVPAFDNVIKEEENIKIAWSLKGKQEEYFNKKIYRIEKLKKELEARKLFNKIDTSRRQHIKHIAGYVNYQYSFKDIEDYIFNLMLKRT